MQCALCSAAMALLVSCGHKKEATADMTEPVSVALPTVDSVTVYKTYPGYATANITAKVVGRVSGTLLTKNYQSGDFVKKGQVLFTIESTKYRDAVQQAQASLATAKSELDYATKQYRAMKIAMESDAVSQMDLIQAESNMEQAQASVKNAEAALSTARMNLGYCTVTAPVSGMITSSALDVGNFIDGEASPVDLATVYDVSSIIFDFAIEDTQYERMLAAKGDPEKEAQFRHVPLTFSESLPHQYYADLFYTAPAVDKSTGTLMLMVRVDNPYKELRPGMYATVNMPAETLNQAILVKDASIGTDQLGKYLYVVNDSNKVVYTPIKVGDLYQDSLRIVNSGIDKNSRYVTTALLKVRDGMKVNPIMSK